MDISKAKTSLKRPYSDTATGSIEGAEKIIILENQKGRGVFSAGKQHHVDNRKKKKERNHVLALAGIMKKDRNKYYCTMCQTTIVTKLGDLDILKDHVMKGIFHLKKMAKLIRIDDWDEVMKVLHGSDKRNKFSDKLDVSEIGLEFQVMRHIIGDIFFCTACQKIFIFIDTKSFKEHINESEHKKAKFKAILEEKKLLEEVKSKISKTPRCSINKPDKIKHPISLRRKTEYVEDSGWNVNNFNPALSNSGQLSGNVDQWNNFNERNTNFGFRECHNNPNEEMMYSNSSFSQDRPFINPNPTTINEELQIATEEIRRLKREASQATDEITKLRWEVGHLREENVQLKMNEIINKVRSSVAELPPTENLNIRELCFEQAFQENQQIKNTNTQQHGNNQHSRRYFREMDEVHHENQNQKLGVGRGLSNAEREPAFSWNSNNNNINNKWNIGEKEKGYYDKASSRDGSQYNKPSTSTGSKYNFHDDKSFNNQFSSKYEERRDGGQYGSFTFSNSLQDHSKPKTNHGNNRPFNNYNESGMFEGSKGEGNDQWGYQGSKGEGNDQWGYLGSNVEDNDQWGYQNHSTKSSTPYHSNMQNSSINQSTHQQRDTRGLDLLSSKPIKQREPWL